MKTTIIFFFSKNNPLFTESDEEKGIEPEIALMYGAYYVPKAKSLF